MDSPADIANWIMVALGVAASIGGLIGYLIRQNTRIAVHETEINQLKDLVGKNAQAVQELAVSMAGISEKLTLLIDMQRHE